MDGKQNTHFNELQCCEWKDLSGYELNFAASGSVYKKNDGYDYVELNDQADILVSERNSIFRQGIFNSNVCSGRIGSKL